MSNNAYYGVIFWPIHYSICIEWTHFCLPIILLYNELSPFCRWWVGEWQACSMTCGPSGLKKRTVFCIRTVGAEEQALPPSECRHLLKPKPQVPCNRDVLCSSHWIVDNWSEVRICYGTLLNSRQFFVNSKNYVNRFMLSWSVS